MLAVVFSKETTPNIQYVHSTLLAHEGRIEQRRSTVSDLTVNFTSNNKFKNQERNNNNKNQSNSQRGGQSFRFRGRNGRYNNNNNRLRCQIYENGLAANKCYFRFDANYIPSQQNNNNSRNHNLSANIINTYPESKEQADTKSTETAKIDGIQDENWYPDSRATNHVTNNLNNLNLGSREYKGKQLIHMDNGESVEITHTGNVSFTGRKEPFLKKLLRVSSIRNFLSSVSQFA